MRERYTRRRELAGLSRFPEGYEFTIQLIGGERRNAFVLSPPDLVAVQDEDGAWFRRAREDGDGPAPYSVKWYDAYLAAYGSPAWFLQDKHVKMLDDREEADAVGRQMVPQNLTLLPLPNYLEVRYPAAPAYPTPNVFNRGEAYEYHMNHDEQLQVARRFPATNVTDPDYRIFVLPSGHIRILHEEEAGKSGLHLDDGAMPWLLEQLDNFTASYLLHGSPPARTMTGTRADRSAMLIAHRARGAYVNPSGHPRGYGRLLWLTNDDYQRAQQLGFRNAVEIPEARGAGLLSQGVGQDAPTVVWYPHRLFVNPEIQPQGAGTWEYHTNDDRDLAYVNFGGQAAFGFGNIAHPSAAEMWTLRQELQHRIAQGEDIEDFTLGGGGNNLNLVWVPVRPPSPVVDDFLELIDDTEVPDEELLGEESDAEAEVLAEGGVGWNIGQTDLESGLTHEPHNNNDRDQTGTHGRARYQTRMLPEGAANAKNITVDRSRCHAGTEEPHKAWAIDSKGKWRKYHNYGNFNWNDKNSVEALNKWREQNFNRYGWPKKRTEKRVSYTEEEEKWLFDRAKPADNAPTLGRERLEQITAAFNKKFASQPGRPARNLDGITSAIYRLQKMLAEHGRWVKGKERGENLKDMHETKRQEKERRNSSAVGEEDSDVDDSPRKKAKKDGRGSGKDNSGEGGDGEDSDADAPGEYED